MKNLQAWTEKWATTNMFAGVPGVGAEEGWYLTQLTFEAFRLQGKHITAGSIDVYKCFDQINRTLVYELAQSAGMPKTVLDTYYNYIDNLDVRYQIGKTLGKQHRDKSSIPQGCPFSMNMVALLMRPWIMKMKDNGIEPRTLADDLFFFTKGENNEQEAIKGMEMSLQFFEDIGAKVAPKKCFMTSSSKETRKNLRKKLFGKKAST